MTQVVRCCSVMTMLFGDATTSSAAVVASANDDDDNNDDALSPDNTTLLSLDETEKTPLSSMPASVIPVELSLGRLVRLSDCLSSEEGAGKLHGGHTVDEGIFASDGDKSLSVTFLAAAAVSTEPLSSSLTASWSENVADIASNCPLTSLGGTKPGEA